MATPVNVTAPESPYKALIQARTNARRRLTRTQSALTAVQQQRDNLVGAEEDTEEVRDILDEREVTILDELEVLMAEVHEIQEQIDEILARRSRARTPAVSVAGNPPREVAEMDGKVGIRTRTAQSYLESEAESDTPRVLLQQTVRTNRFHQQLGDTVLDESDRYRSAEGSPDEAYSPPQLQNSRMGFRSHKAPSDTKFILPQLTRTENFYGFTKRLDESLKEYGWMVQVNGVNEYLESAILVNRIVDSMKECRPVYEAAQRIVETKNCPSQWRILRDALQDRFCDRELLRTQMETKLNALHLTSSDPATVEEYLLHGEETLSIYSTVYPDDQECRYFKGKMIEALPTQIRGTIKLQLRLAYPDRDLETIAFKPMADIIRMVCKSLDSTMIFKKDSTKYAGNSNRQERPNPQEFAKGFSSVFAAYTNKKLTAESLKEVDGFLEMHGKLGVWYVVGFRGAQKVDRVRALLEPYAPGLKVREWRDKAKKDSLCLVSVGQKVPPPIILSAWQRSEEVDHKLCILVDSGAGRSYVTLPADSPLQRLCYEGPLVVTELADGSECSVNTYVRLALEIDTLNGSRLGPFEFELLLLNKQANNTQVLLGRSHMIQHGIDIVTSNGLQCYVKNELVFDACNIPLPENNTAYAVYENTRYKLDMDIVLNKLVAQGWSAVPGCENFQVRIRPLKADEVPDPGTNQTHTWEVKIPPRTATGGKAKGPESEYQTIMYDRLASHSRLEYDKIVEKYCDSGFWWLEDKPEHSGYRRLADAPVFLTYSGHNPKARLVCDLRLANTAFNCTSYTCGVVDYIAKLRLAAPPLLIAGDVEQAFYHVRLHEALVVLRLGDGRQIYSDRMTFGLAFGTATLDYVLRAMVSQLSGIKSCFIDTYVDDFLIGATPSGIAEAVEVMEKLVMLFGLTGCNCNPTKFGTILTDRVRGVVESLPLTVEQKALILGNVKDTLSIVGTNFKCDEEYLYTMCNASNGAIECNPQTKKDYFRLAGIWGYDPTGLHPEKRNCADVIRRIVGPLNVYPNMPKKGWNELVVLPDDQKAEIDTVIQRMQEGPTSCEHAVPLHSDDQIIVELHTDASDYGGGYVISIRKEESGEKYDLLKSAWKWSSKQVHAHSNVKEMRSLNKGIAMLANCVHISQFMKDRISQIKIFSDNEAAVGWAKNVNPRKVNECLMRRSLIRLIESVNEEKVHLSQVAPTTISHIKGTDNTIADELSRDSAKAVAETSRIRQAILDRCADLKALDELYDYHRGLKTLLHCWRSEQPPDECAVGTEECIRQFWEMIQNGMEKPEHNYYTKENGLIVATDRCTDGTWIKRILIPDDAHPLVQLIIRDTHRRAAHGSIDNTCARIRESFCLKKLKSKVRHYVRQCLVCQRGSATRGAAISENCTTKDKTLQPYEESEVDVVYLNKTWKVLSITCRSTGHVTLVSLDSEDTAGILKAIFRATLICGVPKLLYSDGASYFRSERFKQYFQALKLSANAPWEGGLHESLHRLGIRVIKNILQDRFARAAPKSALEREWVLRQACIILNTRPLSISRETMISPDHLAFGYNRRLHAADYQTRYGKRLAAEEIRKKFAKLYVIQLREHSLTGSKNKRSPTWKPQVGDTILVYMPTEGKETFDWRVAEVIEIYVRRVRIRRKGKIEMVNINNIAPLLTKDEDEDV